MKHAWRTPPLPLHDLGQHWDRSQLPPEEDPGEGTIEIVNEFINKIDQIISKTNEFISKTDYIIAITGHQQAPR